MTATTACGYTTDDQGRIETWQVGATPFFEYHCWENPSSHDAPAWYRSHQQVTVTGMHVNDSQGMTRADRDAAAMPFTYTVRFADGLEWGAFEDELLPSETHYTRPDPPRR